MKKKYKKRGIILLIAVAAVFGIYHFAESDHSETRTKESQTNDQSGQELLNVPLESQFDEPALENGCEVTSLSMLLNYYGFETTKNQLADELDFVPVFNEDGTHGDPNEGFVGDISGGDWAMGVFVDPIGKVAKKVTAGTKYTVHTKKEASFTTVKKLLDKKIPVWTLVSVNFQIPGNDDFMLWDTQNGQVYVSPLIHACIVTGYDNQFVYVNDPYGYKNRKVPVNDFKKVFSQMDGQMLYLSK